MIGAPSSWILSRVIVAIEAHWANEMVISQFFNGI
jgi:hypothetical protein